MIGFGEFCAARQALWLDKTYGIPAENFIPKEHADLLRPHHLTNVWRELDRGTLHVINDLQIPSLNSYLAVHRTLLYRFFNSYAGYNRYMETVREPGNPSTDEITEILNQPGNFSGAYIRTIKRELAVQALKSLPKHAEKIADMLDDHAMLDTREDVVDSRKKIRAALGEVPSFGSFLADQLMLDFCWFGNPWKLSGFVPGLGPGAKRGLERLGSGYTFKDALNEASTALEKIPKPQLSVKIDTYHVEVGVPVDYAIVEHQLCEYEKLMKYIEAENEGTGRRVKMRKYTNLEPRERDAKPRIHPLPKPWLHPNISKNL